MEAQLTLNQILQQNNDRQKGKENEKRLQNARKILKRIWEDSHSLSAIISELGAEMTIGSLKQQLKTVLDDLGSQSDEIIKQISLIRERIG